MSWRHFYSETHVSERTPPRWSHLSRRLVALKQPTPRHWASNPVHPLMREGCVSVYMALQPIRRAARHVAMTAGGLLPHLFTLAPSSPGGRRGSYSLSRCSAVADSSPLESMVLCVARTFLLPLISRQATLPSYCRCKVKIFSRDNQITDYPDTI